MVDITSLIDTSGLRDGQPADPNSVLVPVNDLIDVLNDILNGEQAFDLLKANSATQPISGGTLTPSAMIVTVQAQSGTADDLDTITLNTGGYVLLMADVGDTITLTTAGNLNIEAPLVLTGNSVIALLAISGGVSLVGQSSGLNVQEGELGASVSVSQLIVPYNTLQVPPAGGHRLAYLPHHAFRDSVIYRAYDDDVVAIGGQTPTYDGNTRAAGISTSGTFCNFTSLASAADRTGFETNSFLLTRPDRNPSADILIRAPNDMADYRAWIGLFSASPANNDTNATIHGVGMRFSSGTDTNWRLWAANGSSSTLTDSGVVANTLSTYHLHLHRDPASGNWIVWIDDEANAFTLSATLPNTTTALGLAVYCWPKVNTAKGISFHRAVILT